MMKLSDSEYRFMQIVWDHAPLGSGKLVELCLQHLGWKKSTTYTTLKKLCDKGYLQNEQAVVSVLKPLQDEVARLEKDKAYIDGIIKNNAEKANYFATKTLRKVQKKVGFPERIR